MIGCYSQIKGSIITALFIDHISNELIDAYLQDIDFEKILLNFGLIEPNYENDDFESQKCLVHFKLAGVSASTKVMDQNYSGDITINCDTVDQTVFGDEA